MIFLTLVSGLHIHMLDKMFQIINVSVVALKFHDLILESEVNFSTTWNAEIIDKWLNPLHYYYLFFLLNTYEKQKKK